MTRYWRYDNVSLSIRQYIIMTKLAEQLLKKLAKDRYNQRQFAIENKLPPSNFNAALNGKRNITMTMARAIYRKYPELVDLLLE